jgi:hypothetical protein
VAFADTAITGIAAEQSRDGQLAGGRDRDGHPWAIHLAHRAAIGQEAAASGPEHRSRNQHGRVHPAS